MIAPIKKQLANAFPIYELKITLCGSKPAIWRRVQVSGGIKLNRLYDVLQTYADPSRYAITGRR